ncbi:SDR family epimerase/dehydratase [Amycolatopsis suaedae]|uniref:SDR family epimerase/dehydratase n=1 Tax=Amycolatopsis suaedae TaxID=2510978 RepID=A0A4Q7J5M2_9PSEU|nr:SDR family epimerase/dehydratase [Amycolatopsis suaedae]
MTVLGSSGLLGTAITRMLASQPVRLRLVGRRETTVPRSCEADVEVRTLDLATPGAVAEAVTGADTVFHLVAHISGASTWRVSSGDPVAERVNTGLVHDLVDAIRTERRATAPIVLFAGSMSQAGRVSKARIDGSEPDRPLTTYDKQKLEAEKAILNAHAEGLIRGSSLRLATLYTQGSDSPSLDRGVVAGMMRRAFAGQPLTMWHDGTVKRDLICVDDVASAFITAYQQIDVTAGRPWLIGSGQATSVAELFGMISKTVATRTGDAPVPVTSVEPAEHSMPTDLLDFVLDPSAFQSSTGWTARVPLLEGLDRLAGAMISESTATTR